MIMANKRKPTTNAAVILRQRYYEGKPRRIAQLEGQRADDEVARKIFAARARAGLTQKQLAEMVGPLPLLFAGWRTPTTAGIRSPCSANRSGVKQKDRNPLCAAQKQIAGGVNDLHQFSGLTWDDSRL